MRVCFPNKEHPDALLASGDTTLGSAADNTIVLKSNGIAPHHAVLSVNERSIVLGVADAQARLHVNGRAVREKALLRLGDMVSLDTVTFLLKPDRDDSVRTQVPQEEPLKPEAADDGNQATRAHRLPPKVVLRGVSGIYFGKIVPVRGRLVIGRGTECDLILDEPEMSRRHALIENSGDGIYLRDLGSANGTFVNGVQVRNAVLFPDDQIAFDRNRFLLEAPSLPQRDNAASEQPGEVNITQTMRAVPKPAAAPVAVADERNKNDIWWLIGAAVLIAAGIATLLYVSF